MRVLVTGGAGFIGSHVVDAFVAAGHQVAILDRSRIDYVNDKSGAHGFYLADVLSHGARGYIHGGRFDVIAHLAADPSAGTDQPEGCALTHLAGMTTICGALAELPVNDRPRLIFASSAAVYGNEPDVPATERSLVKPSSPYGLGKTYAEMWGRWCADNRDLAFVALRLSNVFGPRQGDHTGVIARWCGAFARKDADILLTAPSETIRDFVFVTDVAQAFLAAATAPHLPRALNISTGVPHTLYDIAERLNRIVGARKVRLFKYPVWGPKGPHASVLNPERAAVALRWHAETDFDTALAETYRWYAERHSHDHATTQDRAQ